MSEADKMVITLDQWRGTKLDRWPEGTFRWGKSVHFIEQSEGVKLDDFYAYMPGHNYIFCAVS